jgi:hypothetical protein
METIAKSSKRVDEVESLSMELSALSRQQSEALQRSSYVKMPPRDADEYDNRRLRIAELCEFLSKFRRK